MSVVTLLSHVWWDDQGGIPTKSCTETVVEENIVRKDKKQKSIELFIIYTGSGICQQGEGYERYGDFLLFKTNQNRNVK